MAVVTSIFARRMVQAAGSAVSGAALLRSVGLDPDAGLDVTQMVAAEAYYGLLERIARSMPDGHELPLRVGPLMRPDDYGALGLAWKSAPTVRQSLERVERFCRLWTDNLTYEVRDDDDGAQFVLHREGPRRLGLRLSNEATIASATSLIRQTASVRFRPRAVYLKHAAPATTTAHERYFGCPVHFGSDDDALALPAEALARPNHLADDGISRFLLSHLEAAIDAVGTDTVSSQVRRVVSRSLSEGVPGIEEVGRRLGMSPRTLQRRLDDEGESFKALVDRTRYELARNLITESRYTLAEVAFLSGFSEQSAFSRAFKRWSGQTPAAMRATAASGSPQG